MKSLKIFIVIILMMLCLVSCNRAYSPVNRLESLIAELEENSSNYSAEDWSYAIEEYGQIESELAEYSYSEEEVKEIARLKGKCYPYLLRGAAIVTAEGIDDQIDYFENFMEGFGEEIDNQMDYFENAMESYEEKLDNRIDNFENSVDEL